MINVEDLLKPVADGKPSGDDFSYHESFQKMEELARGKPETQFSAAEEPKWKDVKDAALDVLRQSKHLGAAVVLTRSLVKLDGAEGMRDGFAVVRGMTEKFWPDLYPRLDPASNNDPTERLNTLSNFSGGRFRLDLQQIVLCESPSLGRITMQQYITAKDAATPATPGSAPAAKPSGPDIHQITAAFRDAKPEAVQGTFDFVTGAISDVEGIDKFLDTTLGAGRGVNFEDLKKLLGRMKEAIQPYVTTAPPATPNGEPSPVGANQVQAQAPPPKVVSGVSGTVENRSHVITALDMVRDYYAKYEPSSPVPLLIERAKSLVDKDFMSIMKDLNPDALAKLQVITGGKTDK